MFIDTHSHVHFGDKFPDVFQVVERAKNVGVGMQILVGCSFEDSVVAGKFCEENLGFHFSIGVHPHESGNLNEEVISNFRLMIKGEYGISKKPVAIGEIGLDYFRNLQSVDVQKSAFEAQLKLARDFDLPVILHVRDAFKDVFDLVKEVGNKKVLFHCFSGGMAELEVIRERDYFVSFSGIVTYPKNFELLEVVKKVRADRFVVETDCPYLPPNGRRGQRNEPAFVVEIYQFIAKVRGEFLGDVEKNVLENVKNLFGI